MNHRSLIFGGGKDRGKSAEMDDHSNYNVRKETPPTLDKGAVVLASNRLRRLYKCWAGISATPAGKYQMTSVTGALVRDVNPVRLE